MYSLASVGERYYGGLNRHFQRRSTLTEIMFSIRSVRLLLAGLAGLAGGPSAAKAAFGEPAVLNVDHVRPAQLIGAAAGPDGSQWAAYRTGRRLLVWRRGDSTPEVLGAADPGSRYDRNSTTGILAIGGDGAMLVAWIREQIDDPITLAIATAPPNGDFSRPQLFDLGNGAITLLGAAGPTGQMVVAWSELVAGSRYRVHATTGRPGQHFEAPQALTGAGRNYASAVAVGQDGTSYVAWHDRSSVGHLSRRSETSTWSAPEAIPGDTTGDMRNLIALPDNSVLASTGLNAMARRAPDGTWTAGLNADGVAGQAALAAGAGAPTPVSTRGDGLLQTDGFAWVDGTRSALFAGTYFDETPLAIDGGTSPKVGRDGLLDGPVIFSGEQAWPIAGEQPGQLTVLAAHEHRLYAFEQPSGTDRRPPRIDLHPLGASGQDDRGVQIAYGSVDERAHVTATATIRVQHRWQPTQVVLSTLGRPFRGPVVPFQYVSASLSRAAVKQFGCAGAHHPKSTDRHVRIRLRVEATDTAGHASVTSVENAIGCSSSPRSP